MRKLTLIILTMLFLFTVNCSLLAVNSFAAEPPRRLINYQGRLTDSQGVPLNDSYNVTFRIYDAEGGGSAIWTETHAGLTIQKGIFSTLIGGVTPLNLAFDKQYWLSIQVGSDPEMYPRQILTSSAYAFTSENANKVANVEVSATPAANKLLPLDANAKLPVGVLPIMPSRSQLFTSSGTFTAPAGVSMVFITMIGGGGGGGGGWAGAGYNPDSKRGGGGGAAGEVFIKCPFPVVMGNTYPVTIGAAGIGGASGTAGTAGGNVSFGSIVARGGGGGGNAHSAGNGAPGTSYGGPDGVTTPGSFKAGSGGGGSENGIAGNGAAGHFGGIGGVGGPQAPGGNASGYGAGGGGGGAYAGASTGYGSYGGGNGSTGFCLIEW